MKTRVRDDVDDDIVKSLPPPDVSNQASANRNCHKSGNVMQQRAMCTLFD